MDRSALISTPVIAGLAAHAWCHWREPSTMTEMLLLLVGVPVGLSLHAGYSAADADTNLWVACLRAALIYFLSLTISIIVYRLSPFHPLSRYPGPLAARVTRFWAFYKVLEAKQHEYYYELHKRYGDIVRIGPNHLSVRDARAIPVVLGSGSAAESRWVRGPRYLVTNLPDSAGSLINITSIPAHSARRRIWARAFTPAALKDYEPKIHNRACELVNAIRSREGQVVDLAIWLNYFSIDFMGDLAFGGEFHFLEEGYDYLNLQNTLQNGVHMNEAFGTIPWVRPIFSALPRPTAIKEMYGTSMRYIINRQKGGSSTKDIFYHLLDESGSGEQERLSLMTLTEEACLALVAGSDTTAAALSNTFYYLVSSPDIYKRLRKEVDDAIPANVEIPDAAMVASIPLLQAVIQEVLRLQPGVPSGGQRMPPSPQDVALFDDVVVPAHTTVQIPPWSLHRDPRYFSPNPESFYPDRWLKHQGEEDNGEIHHNPDAWIPFSHGPANCIGKQLAITELKVVISTLVRLFDFEFAPGWDTQEWCKNLTDRFVLVKGALPMKVSRRVIT